MIKSDDGEFAVLARGRCPFCHEPILVMCPIEKLSESVKIVDGRVTAVLCKTYAHPPCSRLEQATGRGKSWKWLWRKANIRIDETPLDESLN